MIEPAHTQSMSREPFSHAESGLAATAGVAGGFGQLSTESVNNSESVWITPTFNHIVRRLACRQFRSGPPREYPSAESFEVISR
jgi:hypothetical protein